MTSTGHWVSSDVQVVCKTGHSVPFSGHLVSDFGQKVGTVGQSVVFSGQTVTVGVVTHTV